MALVIVPARAAAQRTLAERLGRFFEDRDNKIDDSPITTSDAGLGQAPRDVGLQEPRRRTMKFSYGLIPKVSDNNASSLAQKYVEHFGDATSLETADARFTQGMKDANLNNGPLWGGMSWTGVEGGGQSIATVRQAIDLALGELRGLAK